MSSVHCRSRVVFASALCILASGLRAPAQPQPDARSSPLATDMSNVRFILADLKQSCEKGQVTQAGGDPSRPDARMQILSLLIRDKIPYAVSKRIADDAAREAILAELRATADYIDRELMPAYNKAVQSKDPADARALVPLLDGLSPRLTRVDETAVRYVKQAPPARANGQSSPPAPGASPDRLRPAASPATTVAPAPAIAPAPTPAPADEWARYVQQFILTYRLDDAQEAQAWSILKDLQGRAGEYRISHKADYEAASRIDDRTAQAERLQALDKPLNEMFEELKARLAPLPTEAQRKAASAGKPATPAATRQPRSR